MAAMTVCAAPTNGRHHPDRGFAFATATTRAHDAEGEGRLIDEEGSIGLEGRTDIATPLSPLLLGGECVAIVGALFYLLSGEARLLEDAT